MAELVRLDPEAILYRLLSGKRFSDGVSFENLREVRKILEAAGSSLGVTIYPHFDENSLHSATEQYPELFRWGRGRDDDKIVRAEKFDSPESRKTGERRV